jgi:hypothetical protein
MDEEEDDDDEDEDDDENGLSKEELEQIERDANREAGLDESGQTLTEEKHITAKKDLITEKVEQPI